MEVQSPTGARARIKVASLNIKGRASGEITKLFHIPQLMREKGVVIMALQETHKTDKLASVFESTFGQSYRLIHSPDPDSRNARGVAFVLNKRMTRTEDVRAVALVPGRALLVSIPWKDETRMTVLNVYAPNSPGEMRELWTSLRNSLRGMQPARVDVMLGDFNLVEDALDRIPSSQGDEQATELLRTIRTNLSLDRKSVV